jgi:hypothetical protein
MGPRAGQDGHGEDQMCPQWDSNRIRSKLGLERNKSVHRPMGCDGETGVTCIENDYLTTASKLHSPSAGR